MKKKITQETDLLIELIEETIELRTMMCKLHRKIHSKYYELLRKYNENCNGLLVRESRGRRILHPTQFERGEFDNNGIITFD
tara:strand:- start:186 stop:431 length:246 start_codon:yes stop_codon:yes gene_type:complete